MSVIDYYFTVASPWAYLGHRRLADIAEATQSTLRLWPVDYGAIFPQTGGLPLPKRAPARQAYRLQELRRWKAQLDVPFKLQPKYHPIPPALADCLLIAARLADADCVALAEAVMRACFAEDQDISDAATLAAIADRLGLDGAELAGQAASDEVKAVYAQDSHAALECGVFGAPTYVIGDELFWGQDRLDFVEQYLKPMPA